MNYLKVLIVFIFLSIPVFLPSTVSAQFNPVDTTCDELTAAERSASEVCNEASEAQSPATNPITGTESVILRVADLLSFIAGVIAVIMIIIGGITMITSAGDSGKVKKSRDTIIFSIIGIIVVISARAIVIFIVGNLT